MIQTQEKTPTVTNGAYSSGDAVGGKLTFSGVARSGRVKNVQVVDKAGNASPYELHLFRVDFTAMSDNGAWNPSDADALNEIAVVQVGTAFSGSSNSISDSGAVDVPYHADTGDLYGQLVVRDTPTLGSTSDIQVNFQYEAD